MVCESTAGQAHGDKTGERGGLKKSTVTRLNIFQDTQGSLAGDAPK